MIELITGFENVDAFIKNTFELLLSKGVKIEISPDSKVSIDGTYCSGFFGDLPPTFVCATGLPLPRWLSVFAHEASHFDQWQESSLFWTSLREKGIQEEELIFEWIKGREFDETYLKEIFEKTRLLEWDCERRTVEKIRQHNLPIDLHDYILSANACIVYYEYVLKNRNWHDGKRIPFHNSEFLSMQNSSLDEMPILTEDMQKYLEEYE